MAAVRWATGGTAVLVLVGTGAWAMWPADVDAELWAKVRPAIEARLVTESRGGGYGETVPGLGARWFCRAEALRLEEGGDLVRAGVDTLCVEYGAHGGSLVECSAAHVPQVVRLERDASGAYRVVSREEAPDGEGNARWTRAHFGAVTASALNDAMSSGPLEAEARIHFGLPADAPVEDC